MIFGVLNQKGGVGKTTVAVNLCHALALRRRRDGTQNRALLVDADPQGSALAWSSAREETPLFPVVGMAKPTLHRDLPEIASDYDRVVIDGAPRVSELGRAAILASDFIVIPVQPSPYDIWATEDTVALIREAQQFKENLKAVFVVNRKIANTAISRSALEALQELGFPVLDASLCQRVAFAESAAEGRTVLETEPNGRAAREVVALAREIRRRWRTDG